MKKTVQIDEQDLISIFQQGVQGNAASFVLLARRLVSKLKKSDLSSAEVLADLLGDQPITRNVVRPVDVDSRLGLLREEKDVVLDYEPIWPEGIAYVGERHPGTRGCTQASARRSRARKNNSVQGPARRWKDYGLQVVGARTTPATAYA